MAEMTHVHLMSIKTIFSPLLYTQPDIYLAFSGYELNTSFEMILYSSSGYAGRV